MMSLSSLTMGQICFVTNLNLTPSTSSSVAAALFDHEDTRSSDDPGAFQWAFFSVASDQFEATEAACW
jgi:hypothetical protein